MKKLYEENDIRKIADAIRVKSGGGSRYKVADMANAVLAITAAGGENYFSKTENVDENGIWHRPEDWDDIESIEIPEGKSELYLLYANHIGNGHSFCRLRVYGSGLKWARGHVINGAFVNSTTDATLSSGGYIAIDLEALQEDYSVIRITGTTITQCLPYAWNGTNAAYVAQYNSMLMRYGRMPKGTNIVTATYYLESDNVMDFAKDNSATALTLASAYNGCYNLKRWRHQGWNVAGNTTTSLASFMANCYCLTDVDNLNFDGWASSKTTTIASFMSYCSTVGKAVSVKNWDVSSVTTMASVFYLCATLPRIDGLETWTAAPKCTTVNAMFYYCFRLHQDLDLRNWSLGNGTANFTTMSSFLCSTLVRSLDISGWNLSKVTTIATFITSNRCLTDIRMNDIVPPAAITACGQMFFGNYTLKELVLDGWDFSNCTSLTTGPFYQPFYTCVGMKKLVLRNCKFQTTTTNDSSTSYGYYVYTCYNLRYLDVSDIDLTIFTGANMHSYGFRTLTCLVDFFPPKNICKTFNLSGANMLSHDSLMRVINNLQTVASATLTIGAINKAKLTAEELAIATDKGWTIA